MRYLVVVATYRFWLDSVHKTRFDRFFVLLTECFQVSKLDLCRKNGGMTSQTVRVNFEARADAKLTLKVRKEMKWWNWKWNWCDPVSLFKEKSEGHVRTRNSGMVWTRSYVNVFSRYRYLALKKHIATSLLMLETNSNHAFEGPTAKFTRFSSC